MVKLPQSITAPAGFIPFSKPEIEQSIPDRFEKQVRLYPHRLAVKGRERELSYDELNRLANRIGRAMTRLLGEEPARVVLALEKDSLMIAAILGTLKAGKTYVPVDPAFPEERNHHIAENSEAALVLTNHQNLPLARDLGRDGLPILNLDELDPSLSDENLRLSISPDSLAYIIYTSGSTGHPKGVVQNHRNVLHGAMRRTNLQGISFEDRMTLLYSCSVMGSVHCIFTALLNGAALFPYDIREEGLADLAEWLKECRITIYHSVASVFRHFFRTLDSSERFDTVRLVIFGGERVLVSDIKTVREVFSPACEVFTGLGATETGTIRKFIIHHDTPLSGKIVPIGYPVEDMDVVLLDGDGREVETGGIGEIVVRSRYNALGYWKQKELTDGVFVRVENAPGVTAYRTGDLGCLREDGLLVHKGRKDFQVKVRGFRIEIAEIEMALLELRDIHEAVVIAKEDARGETQLVAYLVMNSRAGASLPRLRRTLQEKLPYYMIPAIFISLEAIPLTPNGKVNRKALPDPEHCDCKLCREVIPPRTPVEKTLVKIWEEVLNADSIGIDHHFFEAGGHSLSATQVISRVLDAFRVKLPMRVLFESPNLEAVAEYIERAEKVDQKQCLPPMIAGPREEKPPLSFAQVRMWLLDQLNPGGSAAYNISNSMRLKGILNVSALEKSLNAVIRRHESLRTIFLADAGVPYQKVVPFTDTPLEILDFSGMAQEERETQLRRHLDQHTRCEFDLSKGPLLKFALVKLEAEEHALLLTFHHIIYDNIWSSGVLFRELAAHYAASCRGEDSRLPALAVQYADYAQWQNTWLTPESLQDQMAYWKVRLRDAPAVLELPTDRPRTSERTYRGGQERLQFPETVKEALMKLNREEGTTMFMTLLAVWKLLLFRYSNQEDVLVGTPIGGRNHVETEPLIGLFINTLALRTDFSNAPTFRELLKQVRETSLEAFAHQDLPFEQLVANLNINRDLSVSPLFQVLFIFQNSSVEKWQLPGLEVTPLESHGGGSKFDLTLSMTEEPAGLKGYLEYSADLFDQGTIQRMVGHLGKLIEAVVSDPDKPVSQIDLLSESERRALLVEANQTQADYPRDRCAHELVAERAKDNPDGVAVFFGKRHWTYGELEAQANRLARSLKTRGVRPGDLVGICLDRSLEMVAAMLAVWKVGGAYVPIDPAFPKDRIAFVLEDANAPMLISESGLVQSLPTGSAQILRLDSEWERIQRESGAPLELASTPEDLAYVIYTSGSTGKPKGVRIPHRALVNFLWSMRREPGIEKSDVLLAITTLSFDIAGLEIWLPLIAGAQAIIAGRNEALDPDRLARLLDRHPCTILQATPATWQMLVDAGWKGKSGLKALCGGEALSQTLAEELLGKCGELWNMYGPTETTIWSSVAKLQRGGPIDLGRPIANTRFYVLDKNRRPVPSGVPGELYIGGEGVARGYQNRPSLTREKFVPDPFSGNPGDRLYRTGDLARYRADGGLEYLGRMDHQVKIRGHRIELEEIEHVLAQHDQVKEVVVLTKKLQSAGPQLVAYAVSNGGCLQPEALKRHVQSLLPAYMIPLVVMELPAFPLTPNGKVDRKALPDPDPAHLRQERSFVAPRNAFETRLSRVWEKLLGVGPISVKDNFFDLGGHSMLAVRLIAAIKKLTGRNLPLATLMEAPTIEQMAGILRDKGWRPPWNSLVPIKPSGSRLPLYCIHDIGGNIIEYQHFHQYVDPDQPVYGLQARGLDGKSACSESVPEMAANYLKEIREFQPQGPYYLSGHCFGGMVAYEIARQLRAQGEEVGLLVMLDAFPPKQIVECPAANGSTARRINGHSGFETHWLTMRFKHGIRRLAWNVKRTIQQYFIPEHLRKVEKACHLALWTYYPEPYEGKITLFRAQDVEPAVGAEKMARWEKLARGEFEVVDIPGDHRAMMREPRVRDLAALLNEHLRESAPPLNPETDVSPAASTGSRDRKRRKAKKAPLPSPQPVPAFGIK